MRDNNLQNGHGVHPGSTNTSHPLSSAVRSVFLDQERTSQMRLSSRSDNWQGFVPDHCSTVQNEGEAPKNIPLNPR